MMPTRDCACKLPANSLALNLRLLSPSATNAASLGLNRADFAKVALAKGKSLTVVLYKGLEVDHRS